jgi:hypothetical protein
MELTENKINEITAKIRYWKADNIVEINGLNRVWSIVLTSFDK